jgi:hypothetical protein
MLRPNSCPPGRRNFDIYPFGYPVAIKAQGKVDEYLAPDFPIVC